MSLLAEVDTLYSQRLPFALYRLPCAEEITLLSGAPEQVRSFSELSAWQGESGFLFVPFAPCETNPILLLEGMKKRTEGFVQKHLSFSSLPPVLLNETISPNYREVFDAFYQALKKGDFEKLVLARQDSFPLDEPFALADWFTAACSLFPSAYVYITYTPTSGLWLGCSPEMLLSGAGRVGRTTALAGTQPLEEESLPREWSAKNRREQLLVTQFLQERLAPFVDEIIVSDPYAVRAGAMAHLKTDLFFMLRKGQTLSQIVDELFPTPAVCGLPQHEARAFITAQEPVSRAYYGGLVGYYEACGTSDLYVNIRCIHCGEREGTLFAGGGLLASSQCEEEWLETERKMGSMRSIWAQVVNSPKNRNK